ncbi:hypothetical protein MTIM_33500 [Mycobacterium timonense]|uniref:Uncharacterized protein n=1 Tax=Mycobacterium timonense TaxID=701043 RepID=A0A7I9Z916_9MYCO|nr:hypothetical protein MTIM_33500 [Mycobacterium timonense]
MNSGYNSVLPVSANVTGDDAGVVATGPPAPPPWLGAPFCEFEPHAAAANTNGAVAAAASNLLIRTFTIFSLSFPFGPLGPLGPFASFAFRCLSGDLGDLGVRQLDHLGR